MRAEEQAHVFYLSDVTGEEWVKTDHVTTVQKQDFSVDALFGLLLRLSLCYKGAIHQLLSCNGHIL